MRYWAWFKVCEVFVNNRSANFASGFNGPVQVANVLWQWTVQLRCSKLVFFKADFSYIIQASGLLEGEPKTDTATLSEQSGSRERLSFRGCQFGMGSFMLESTAGEFWKGTVKTFVLFLAAMFTQQASCLAGGSRGENLESQELAQ